MRRPLNECIDSRAFAALILDYEFPATDWTDSYASGRVLVDGCFRAHICGTDRADLIKRFRNNEY